MIKHFVGETISLSLIEPMDGEPFVRLANEKTPSEYFDMDVNAFHELQEVIGMMQHATAQRGGMPMMLINALREASEESDEE